MKKYIPLVVALFVGGAGAVGYSVFAQSPNTSSSLSSITQQTDVGEKGQVSDGDGEQADDSGRTQGTTDQKDTSGNDLETRDDGNKVSVTGDTHDVGAHENSDSKEVEDSN